MKIPPNAPSLVASTRASLVPPRTPSDAALSAREAGLPTTASVRATAQTNSALAAKSLADIAGKIKTNALAEHQRPYLDIVPGHLTEEIFSARDRDGDGALSLRESSLKSGMFRNLDTDGDGLITRTELTDTLRDRLERLLERKPDASVDAFMNKWMERFNLLHSVPQPTDAAAAATGVTGEPVADVDESVAPTPTTREATSAVEATLGRTGGVLTMPPATNVAGATNASFDQSVSLTQTVLQPDGRTVTTQSAADVEAASPTAVRRVGHSSGREYYAKVAAGLSEELDRSGFADRPPTNIRDLVASFGFDARGTTLMMKALQAKYPGGLGVSVFG